MLIAAAPFPCQQLSLVGANRVRPGTRVRYLSMYSSAATRDWSPDERDQALVLRGVGAVAVIEELNRDLGQRVDPAQVAAADAVLRAAMFDASTQPRAAAATTSPLPGCDLTQDRRRRLRPAGDAHRRYLPPGSISPQARVLDASGPQGSQA